MSQQHIHKKGKGRGGKKFIQNGGSSGLNQDLNKAGRGPMPYDSTILGSGKFISQNGGILDNMKNYSINKDSAEADLGNILNSISVKDVDINMANNILELYKYLKSKNNGKIDYKKFINFFQYIEYFISNATAICNSQLNGGNDTLYELVDKLKIYRQEIKNKFFDVIKKNEYINKASGIKDELKQIYLDENSKDGALDVFEPGVKVLKQKDDCAVELKPIGFTVNEYKNFCAHNAKTQSNYDTKMKVNTKMNQYVSDLMDSEINEAITWYNNNISNGTNNLLSVPQKKYDEETINLFFMLFHNDILNYLNSSTSNNAQSYNSENATTFLKLLESQLNKSASSSKDFAEIMNDTIICAKKEEKSTFPDDTSIKTIKNGLLGDISLLTQLLGNAKTSFESKNYNNYKDLYKFLDTGYKNDQREKDNFIKILSQKGKFLFLHDLLQTDDKNKLLPNNSLYDFRDFSSCDVKNFFENILTEDKLKNHFDALKKPLFANPPSASDIQQGQIGDCYFLATLISLLNDTRYGPNFIRKMMIDNQDGTVTVKLYKTSWFDCANIPNSTKEYMDYTCHPVLVTVPKTGQIHNPKSALWVQILEKAYALVRGNQTNKKIQTVRKNNLTQSSYNNNKSKKNISSIEGAIGGGYFAFKILTGCTLVKYYMAKDTVKKLSSEVTPNKNVACTVSFQKSNQIEPYVIDANGNQRELLTNHTYSIRCDSTPNKYILINPHDASEEITFQLSDNSNFESFINRISYIPEDSLEDSIFMSLRMLF